MKRLMIALVMAFLLVGCVQGSKKDAERMKELESEISKLKSDFNFANNSAKRYEEALKELKIENDALKQTVANNQKIRGRIVEVLNERYRNNAEYKDLFETQKVVLILEFQGDFNVFKIHNEAYDSIMKKYNAMVSSKKNPGLIIEYGYIVNVVEV